MPDTAELNREMVRNSDWPGRYFEVQLMHLYKAALSNGGCAIDGGANAGVHTMGMARSLRSRNDRVFSVEPQPALVRAAYTWAKNVKLEDRIVFVEKALGNASGTATFFIDQENHALSSLAEPVNNSSIMRTTVPVSTVDEIAAEEQIAFIKLDLEGGEYNALLGARKTLRRCRPIVAFENALLWAPKQFGYEPDDMFHLFDEIGYEIIDFYGVPVTPPLQSRKTAFMFAAAAKETKQKVEHVFSLFWDNCNHYDLSTWQNTVDIVNGKAPIRLGPLI